MLQLIQNKKYEFYEYDEEDFIKEFKSIHSPDYVRKSGVEAITFYAFKKDGSFREMQIPNLYTHYLEKISGYEPYKQLNFSKKYFTFLDLFHQRINNNQTKGIPAGLFSSHIAVELLMLCVDYDISEKMKDKKMDYIRYVDEEKRNRYLDEGKKEI